MHTSLFRSGLGRRPTSRIRMLLSLLSICAVLIAATTAHAQYFGKTGDQFPARDLDLSPRTRVLIYNNVNQPLDAFAYKGHDFRITFVCVNGTSPEYRMTDYYQAQVWPRKDGTSAIAFPPDVSPFSGSYPNGTDAGKKYADSTTGLIDVLKIPLPPALGPVMAVIIDTATPVAWKIDKVVADGHTFDFRNTGGVMTKRVSNHFTTGGANYNLNNGPLTQGTAWSQVARSYSAFGSVKLPLESFADASLRSRYSAAESYLEPYKPTQNKTITVRVDFANRWGKNTLVKAPNIVMSLIGAGGESSDAKLLDSPLVVNSKFVSFDVAGNFRVKSVRVALAAGTDRADIVGMGLLVEQGLGPEIPFSDWISLTSGGVQSGDLHQYGAGEAPLSVVNPDLDKRIRKLSDVSNDMTLDTSAAALSVAADAVFKGLASDPAGLAAITRFRQATKVEGVSFDTWFLRKLKTPADSTALINGADSLFQSAQVSAIERQGWPAARARLTKTLDDRAAALRFVDTLQKMADESAAARLVELQAAQNFLGLDGGILTTAPQTPPPSADLRKDVRTVFGKVNTTVTVIGMTGSVAKDFASRFGSFAIGFNLALDLVDFIANANNLSSAATVGTVQTTTSTGQDNAFRIAAGNLTLAYGQAATDTKTSLDALRRLCVFDPGMLSDMASLGAAYEVSRSTSAMRDFNNGNVRAIRRQVLSRLLPYRGILYGEPVTLAKDNIYFPAGQPAYAASATPPMVWPFSRLATERECRFYRTDCDGVLAFSAYLAFAYAPLAGTKGQDLQQRAYFHKWRLAFGSDPTQTPELAATPHPRAMMDANQNEMRFDSTWDYIRSALSNEEIMDLVRDSPLRIQQDPQIKCTSDRYATSGWGAFAGALDSLTRCTTLVKTGDRAPIFAFPAYARTLEGLNLTRLRQTTSHLPDAYFTDGKRPYEDFTWWTPDQKTSGNIDQAIFLYGTEKDTNQIILPTNWVELR